MRTKVLAAGLHEQNQQHENQCMQARFHGLVTPSNRPSAQWTNPQVQVGSALQFIRLLRATGLKRLSLKEIIPGFTSLPGFTSKPS
jgi:hypothetical protein